MAALVNSVAAGNAITNALKMAIISNASGSVELDCTHNIFNITQTGDMTPSFTNVPLCAVIVIHVNRTGAFTEDWPSSVNWQDDVEPAPSVVSGLKDVYTLMTVNSGASWTGAPFAQGVPV